MEQRFSGIGSENENQLLNPWAQPSDLVTWHRSVVYKVNSPEPRHEVTKNQTRSDLIKHFTLVYGFALGHIHSWPQPWEAFRLHWECPGSNGWPSVP